MGKLRVSIDATPLLLRSAGVKTYVYYWIQSLREVAARGQAIDLFPFIGEPGECVHDRSSVSALRTFASLAWLQLANATALPLLNAVGSHCHVFHASHQLLRPPTNCRVSATLYDMTCWLVPQLHSTANVRMAKTFARLVLERADGMLAISESTKRDTVRILGLDPGRIAVIYPGVAEAFFTPHAAYTGKPYILFIGTVEPRKNIGVLLDAYGLLPERLRDAFDLVIAGSPGWGDPQVLERLHSGLGGVRYLGYVGEDKIPLLNAGATVFVYPSLYEGFGLPVAQAMAAGVPVITSNVSSLPEVAGDAALLVDPRDAGGLAETLERLLESNTLQDNLRQAGLRRAQEFHWKVCARRSLRYFERVAQGRTAACAASD
ncbi:MAG: glycosyltransferase family 4 protein [Bryobacteraceae bacterium]